jgi:hypothetical protein
VGRLQTVGLPALLELLRLGQRTGTMACASPAGSGKIYVRAGRLVGASSPATRPLPGYLIANGAVTQSELNSIGGISPEAWSQPALGALLVQKGVVPAAQVREALRGQIRDALAELLTWSDGEFSFDSDGSLDVWVVDPQLEFESQAILLQILDQRDEASQATK